MSATLTSMRGTVVRRVVAKMVRCASCGVVCCIIIVWTIMSLSCTPYGEVRTPRVKMADADQMSCVAQEVCRDSYSLPSKCEARFDEFFYHRRTSVLAEAVRLRSGAATAYLLANSDSSIELHYAVGLRYTPDVDDKKEREILCGRLSELLKIQGRVASACGLTSQQVNIRYIGNVRIRCDTWRNQRER